MIEAIFVKLKNIKDFQATFTRLRGIELIKIKNKLEDSQITYALSVFDILLPLYTLLHFWGEPPSLYLRTYFMDAPLYILNFLRSWHCV